MNTRATHDVDGKDFAAVIARVYRHSVVWEGTLPHSRLEQQGHTSPGLKASYLKLFS